MSNVQQETARTLSTGLNLYPFKPTIKLLLTSKGSAGWGSSVHLCGAFLAVVPERWKCQKAEPSARTSPSVTLVTCQPSLWLDPLSLCWWKWPSRWVSWCSVQEKGGPAPVHLQKWDFDNFGAVIAERGNTETGRLRGREELNTFPSNFQYCFHFVISPNTLLPCYTCTFTSFSPTLLC